MDSVLSAGLAGIQAGQSSAFEAAQKIATATVTAAPSDSSDSDTTTATSSGGLDAITEGAVELVASEQQVQASAAVVKAADEVLGTLIDIDA